MSKIVHDFSDTESVRSNYTLSEAALAQRKANGNRKRWVAGLKVLQDKLSLKVDEYRLMEEICSNITALFKFDDLKNLFPDEVDEVIKKRVENEGNLLKEDIQRKDEEISELKEIIVELKEKAKKRKEAKESLMRFNDRPMVSIVQRRKN